jgi:hypothetical protein
MAFTSQNELVVFAVLPSIMIFCLHNSLHDKIARACGTIQGEGLPVADVEFGECAALCLKLS